MSLTLGFVRGLAVLHVLWLAHFAQGKTKKFDSKLLIIFIFGCHDVSFLFAVPTEAQNDVNVIVVNVTCRHFC